MIYRHTKQQVDEYHLRPELNQSQLKMLIVQGIQAFLDKREELAADLDFDEKAHFLIGNAVDAYFSYGVDEWIKMYHYSKLFRKPSDVEMRIIIMTMQKVTAGMVTDSESPDEYKKLAAYPEQIYQAMNEVVTEYDSTGNPKKIGYYMNRKPKTDRYEDDNRYNVMPSVKSGLAQEYWEELITAKGKQILSDVETEIIMGKFNEDGALIKPGVIMSLLMHQNTAFLFNEETEGVDTIYQMPLYFEEDGEQCKILPDILRVAHRNKVIIPLDMKTLTGPILRFNDSVRIRRYDFQGGFYSNGIDKCRDQISALLGIDVSDYTLAPFSFVAESTTHIGTPLIFKLSPEMLRCGEFGDGRYNSGWRQALELYKDWKTFNFSLDERFPSGKLVIETDFKYNEIF